MSIYDSFIIVNKINDENRERTHTAPSGSCDLPWLCCQRSPKTGSERSVCVGEQQPVNVVNLW